MDLAFLGTGGSVPTARRSTACILARVGGERLLFDCGEGSQRQMQRSTGLVQVDEIFLTHLHADHYLGIPGLLKTYDLQERERPLRRSARPGSVELFKALRRISGRRAYEIELIELEPDEAVRHEGYEVRPFAVAHRISASATRWSSTTGPAASTPRPRSGSASPAGPTSAPCSAARRSRAPAGRCRPEQVMGEPRRGRKLVDHRRHGAVRADRRRRPRARAPRPRRQLRRRGDRAGGRDRPLDRAPGGRARRARPAVGMLALVHVSSRYNVQRRVARPRGVPAAVAPRDFDLVEIPFPERGEPQPDRGRRRASRRPARRAHPSLPHVIARRALRAPRFTSSRCAAATYTPSTSRTSSFRRRRIGALLDGAYDGDVSVDELAAHGDLGLGTFNALDGEMIALDGRFLPRPTSTASTVRSARDATPFAAVTWFEPACAELDGPIDTRAAGASSIDRLADDPPVRGADRRRLRARPRALGPAPVPPYRPLAEVVADQHVFELDDV